MSPYGLFGRKQAFNGNDKDASKIAEELIEAYLLHSKTSGAASEAMVSELIASNSFAESKWLATRLEKIPHWQPDFKGRLREAIKSNVQIRSSWGVPEMIEKMIARFDPDEAVSSLEEDIPF